MTNYSQIEEVAQLKPESDGSGVVESKKARFNKTNQSIGWAPYSWNPVTGCHHSCKYCLEAGTLILTASGEVVEIKDLNVGDKIIGISVEDRYYRFVETEVINKWETSKIAYEIELVDGRKLVCSGDHRWLSNRVWKYTDHHTSTLTTNDCLVGFDPTDKTTSDLGIVSIKCLGYEVPMYDISTGTENFIANGIVSHNCYARDIANRFFEEKFEYTVHRERFSAPHNTKIPKGRANEPGSHNVFVCSMADLFGDWVEDDVILEILDICASTPQWNYIFLTKNPKRLLEFEFPKNSWVGTTVDVKSRVAVALEVMPRVDAPVKFISCEPLLEDLEIDDLTGIDRVIIGACTKSTKNREIQPELKWVERLSAAADNSGCKIFWKANLKVRPKEYPKN